MEYKSKHLISKQKSYTASVYTDQEEELVSISLKSGPVMVLE